MVKKLVFWFLCTYVFSVPSNMKSWFMEFCLSLFICSSLAHEQLDRLYSYLEVKNLSIICWCMLNTNVLASKLGAL
jgi:hypothetical protein